MFNRAPIVVAVLVMFAALVASPVGADDQTVGLLLNAEGSFDGYTLFAPMNEGNTYLIDNDGRSIHSWPTAPGVTVTPYLLEDGSVIGMDNGIRQVAWDGSVLWDFDWERDDSFAHHDIEVLPNGNVLFVAVEILTAEEAIIEGRDPDRLRTGTFWPEIIVEVERTGPTTGDVVWKWSIWDHLIQDFDETKNNFGVVGDHPELVDINFGLPNGTSDHDWLHNNGVNYNPELDQIVLSPRQFSEIWIIDHSTTTEEAATNTGGNSGMGGDLLYRWGNPQAYRAGDESDQQLFVQHDAQWIDPGLPGAGNLLIFNNGINRQDGNYSSVDEIVPPIDNSGHYTRSEGSAFGPEEPLWTYSSPSDFYAPIISGMVRLPNGNTLIDAGVQGTIFEVTPEGETVWKYINPLGTEGPLTRGEPIPTTGGFISPVSVFRALRYAPDYPGLQGRDLTPGPVLEIVVDGDRDGLPDDREAKIFGTDSELTDTDGDGIADGAEINLGTNPSDADTDTDGLFDFAELSFGTDPLVADSDGDGLLDGDELRFATDPLQADSDGDGVSDGDEVQTFGSDPLTAAQAGDANCDGEVTSSDAVLILQYVAGMGDVAICEGPADADGDGAVTVRDAQLVLQTSAGL
jgi:hypothetical protein